MIRKHIKLFAAYGGVTATALEWFALLFFYLQEPQLFTGEHPLSYFATLPETKAVFSICYLGAAISFWIFANHHLRTLYYIPIKVFAFSMFAFACLALYPYNPGNAVSNTMHIVLAQASFASFLLGMALMARHAYDIRFKVVTYIAVAISAVLLTALIFQPHTSRLILILEVGAWFMFQVWTIWISRHAYLKARKA